MKRILTSILVAVGITGPFVLNLGAQNHRMVADIPFTFVANNRTMPAGQYDFSQATASGSTFQLRNAAGKSMLLQLGSREDANPNKASVTFACYGKECVLAKITPPGGGTAYSLGTDSVEKNLHHTLGMASMVSIKLAAR